MEPIQNSARQHLRERLCGVKTILSNPGHLTVIFTEFDPLRHHVQGTARHGGDYRDLYHLGLVYSLYLVYKS